MRPPRPVAPSSRMAAADDLLRLGLVALATDLTLEHDLASLLPDTMRLHVARVPFANPTTPENLAAMAPDIAAAADLLVPGVPLAAIGFGCTSGAVIIGDDVIARAIGAVRPGVPVFTPAGSAVQGFRHLGVRRIALLTPYLPQTTAPMVEYFASAGFDVVQTVGLGMADDRDIARVSPGAIRAATRRADHPQAEALFISCTALPVLPLIPALEAELGKPVVSSNQALGWAMLVAAGAGGRGPGRLFAPAVDAA